MSPIAESPKQLQTPRPGRPRLRHEPDGPSEKRRAQVRNAQKTYRLKKESIAKYHNRRSVFLDEFLGFLQSSFENYHQQCQLLSQPQDNPSAACDNATNLANYIRTEGERINLMIAVSRNSSVLSMRDLTERLAATSAETQITKLENFSYNWPPSNDENKVDIKSPTVANFQTQTKETSPQNPVRGTQLISELNSALSALLHTTKGSDVTNGIIGRTSSVPRFTDLPSPERNLQRQIQATLRHEAECQRRRRLSFGNQLTKEVYEQALQSYVERDMPALEALFNHTDTNSEFLDATIARIHCRYCELYCTTDGTTEIKSDIEEWRSTVPNCKTDYYTAREIDNFLELQGGAEQFNSRLLLYVLAQNCILSGETPMVPKSIVETAVQKAHMKIRD